MKRTIARFLLYILFFGITAASLTLWYDIQPELAPGKNMILLSLGGLILFGIWQYRGLRDVFQNPWKSRYNKFIMYSILAIIVIVLLNMTWQTLVYHSEGQFYESWASEEYKENLQNNPELVLTNFSAGTVIGVLVFALYALVIVLGMLISVLYLGRLGLGANIAIITHNWFNGGSFDPSLLHETIWSLFGEVVPIPDFWGVIISILWFLVTTFVLRKNSSADVDIAA